MKKAAFVILAIFLLASPVFAQETEVGLAPAGFNAFELVGRIEQQGFTAVGFGYLNYIRGLPTDQLFAPGTSPLLRGEADARFTFYGTGTSASRSVYENIFAANLPLELTIYYSETPAGASFDNPDSFKSGTPIATFTMRMETILNVQEPNVGVLMAFGESIQSNTAPFTLNSTIYTLGHDHLNHRFSLFGQGFRQVEEPVQAFYIVGGNAMITGSGIQP